MRLITKVNYVVFITFAPGAIVTKPFTTVINSVAL
jgi:hypothetical protein